MTEAEFLRILALAVAQGAIDEESAADLLRRFRAGELGPEALPLPAAEAVTGADDDDALAAILLIIALLGLASVPLTGTVSPSAILGGRRIVIAQREVARNRLRDEFERRIGNLVDDLARSGNVSAWHRAMQEEIKRYYMAQAAAGYGRPLKAGEIARLNEIIRTQEAFLYRFAGETAARAGVGEPFSDAYLYNRSRQYGGEGWSSWFEANEAEGYGSDGGWVVDYIARDDGSTCTPCHDAGRNGPYLPGQGPMPGSVCLGGGACRCERVPRFAPVEWAGLVGFALVG